ncbi:hypothetical protein AAZX31_19G142100 [Glycine max]|uniref:Uncharacterized protein n=2 Tax=Glycine subgen. Soja TaxID=1462606 RepID=K7MYK4_SOYBN|nr:uncharacterized protein LOC100782596 isoform X2 [Glycine max]XP_028217452.1 uncharacterized protein LOC114399455 isoform X2 [Glycine soja]KAG4913147.1 hypothetical protein JHK86_053580 [Glycine max]KAG4916088.1 hypothetical protein JHK87_053645 [Glycine soja]KAG5083566.1 hypothetical protein JHK84_053604 [Glycine max]KAG5086334.1 hypothetical protein JHK82_053731 [Glycine max]KAH1077992.1 hypothetical protein GYH30_053173 [Glycine max]|eukprot:XP_006604435.1 uncharacterized protein LOC100782596 isoform X2 [Glycine max]
MGRKRASKNSDRVQALPTVVEPQPSNGNIQLPRALESQLEIPLPGLTSPKHPNLLVGRAEMRHAKSPAQEQVNQDHGHQKKPPTPAKKKIKFCGASVRRSERIKSSVVNHPNTNCYIEVVEDLTVSDGEKDEADTQLEQVLLAEPEMEFELPLEHEHESEPELADNLGEKKSWKEKVDCALQRIEALDKTVELLKSKVDENIAFCEAPSMASISYKSMYIDSQKKIEALTVENQRLNGKLENALGKIEAYEKEIRVLVDVLDKTKDAVKDTMITNVAKTIEAAVNVSTQAMQIHNACSASAVKRKRNEN